MKFLSLFIILSFLFLYSNQGFGQAEFATWGNMTGIRVNGQLMEFNTSLVLMDSSWNDSKKTRKEGQKTNFERVDQQKIFSYDYDGLSWKESIKTTGKAEAVVDIKFSSKVDTTLGAALFRIDLPEEYGIQTKFKFNSPDTIPIRELSQIPVGSDYKVVITGVKIISPTRELEITLGHPTEVLIKGGHATHPEIQLNFPIASGEIPADKIFSNQFRIKASGKIDDSPLKLEIFPLQEGDPFDGIGGNFRLQNPDTDPQVIDYNLKNLRVAWARVEMPWRYWHSNLEKDPIAEAKKGNIHPKVKAAMEMAHRLDKKGIPVMLAAWFAPGWAIVGKRAEGKNPDGTRGNRLDLTKKEEIYKSLTSYIKYLKEEYGVETVLFSFNESDLGIEVRQTAKEHNQLIKELGAYFRTEGMATEFLLGDTSDAHAWRFTTLASIDPESRPYIGGVSFHSWRGWTRENLLQWADISNRVEEPLFIGEGSIDAAAWRYPEIFEEPTYALDEIDIYVRIMKLAHPLSILQWQLTADYSVLSGGGVFGNNKAELYPTQRFFNLKQLGSTPKGLFYIPISANKEVVTTAALGNMEKGNYAIHIVNNGASREVELTGFPEEVEKLEMYVTNKEDSFKNLKTLEVKDGKVVFILPSASFVSLMTK